MNFKVKPKPAAGAETQDKCPVCKYAWQDFADILGTGILLGCYKCGCVFMSKECRDEDVAGKKVYLEKSSEKREYLAAVVERNDDIVKDEAVCDEITKPKALCGKECKNLAGIHLHEMRCKACAEIKGE